LSNKGQTFCGAFQYAIDFDLFLHLLEFFLIELFEQQKNVLSKMVSKQPIV
jgi:hypothetical protein